MAITFNHYVSSMQDAERHSEVARECTKDLETYITRLIIEDFCGDFHDVNKIMELAMDMAVEYENDGFNAAVEICKHKKHLK